MNHEVPSFASSLGRIVSGCYIVTLKDDTQENAFLASFVMQAGFSPATLALAVGKERAAYTLIKTGKPFTINHIGKEQMMFFKHFGKGFSLEEYPYEGINLIKDKTNAPILADSLGYLEVVYKGEYETNDHVVIFAEVIGGELLQPEGISYSHVRKSGMHY